MSICLTVLVFRIIIYKVCFSFTKVFFFVVCLFCFLKKGRLPHGMLLIWCVWELLEAWQPYILLQMDLKSLFWGSSREANSCIYSLAKEWPSSRGEGGPLQPSTQLWEEMHMERGRKEHLSQITTSKSTLWF